jgi:hypothetical protein
VSIEYVECDKRRKYRHHTTTPGRNLYRRSGYFCGAGHQAEISIAGRGTSAGRVNSRRSLLMIGRKSGCRPSNLRLQQFYDFRSVHTAADSCLKLQFNTKEILNALHPFPASNLPYCTRRHYPMSKEPTNANILLCHRIDELRTIDPFGEGRRLMLNLCDEHDKKVQLLCEKKPSSIGWSRLFGLSVGQRRLLALQQVLRFVRGAG